MNCAFIVYQFRLLFEYIIVLFPIIYPERQEYILATQTFLLQLQWIALACRGALSKHI